MHLFTDFTLLLNGLFVWLIEYASEATTSSSLVNKFDLFFNGYKIFLMLYIVAKFVILIGEIVISQHRMNKIYKSIKYMNLF